MESWQCLQMSHSMLVSPILLWREKLSVHTGLSSLTRQLLLRLPFMLQIIRQRQRLFKPNVNGWDTHRQTRTLVTSVLFVPFSRPIYIEMLESCSQWTTPLMQTQHHTHNYKKACHSMRSLTPWQLWIKTRSFPPRIISTVDGLTNCQEWKLCASALTIQPQRINSTRKQRYIRLQ